MRIAWVGLIALLSFGLGFGCCWVFVSRDAVQAIATVPSNKKILDLSISDGGVYRVRSVVDGDTIVLENGLHLRYNGMDAPESGRWSRDYAPMSKEATSRNIELVEHKRVRLKLARDPIDMYGRVVANLYVVPDDATQPEIEVREVMLKEGFAKFMDLGVPLEDKKNLKEWEAQAKAANAGIWGVRKPADWPQDAKPFCAAQKTKIYHSVNCSQAKRISAASLHEYATREEAEAVGLKPCAICLGRK